MTAYCRFICQNARWRSQNRSKSKSSNRRTQLTGRVVVARAGLACERSLAARQATLRSRRLSPGRAKRLERKQRLASSSQMWVEIKRSKEPGSGKEHFHGCGEALQSDRDDHSQSGFVECCCNHEQMLSVDGMQFRPSLARRRALVCCRSAYRRCAAQQRAASRTSEM